MNFLRTLLILGRVSNLPTVWTNVVVGWLVGGGLLGPEIAWLVGGVSLLYCAGMTLNDAFDANWDKQHASERPIPSGKISLGTTWLIGVLQMIAGIGLLLCKTNARWDLLLGLVIAILAYDWIHKKWQGAVFIMGACRTLVYLLAWSASRINMELPPSTPLIYLISGTSLLYIAGLTMAARGERTSTKGGLAPLPRLLLLLPAIFPMLVYYHLLSDISYALAIGCLIASCCWIVYFRSLLASGKIPQGIGLAIAGISLYDATVAILIDWRAGALCLLCFGLTLVAQKFIPPT